MNDIYLLLLSMNQRLDTIIDYDRIAVLEKGVLMEYDSPANLIAMRDGIFASLVEETGPTQAPRLKAIARGEISQEMQLQQAQTALHRSPATAPSSAARTPTRRQSRGGGTSTGTPSVASKLEF